MAAGKHQPPHVDTCSFGLWSVKCSFQLKYANGALNYGGVAIGGDLDEAMVTLQTKIKIAPKDGEAYYLTSGTSYLDVEADA